MRQLIDTNVLILFLQDHPRLPSALAARIESSDSTNYLSAASLWEISIKTAIGKLQVDYAERSDLPEILTGLGFEILPLDWQAMRRSSSLPWHHRDPFDRIIIAEAQLRALPILSSDSQLDAYGIERVW